MLIAEYPEGYIVGKSKKTESFLYEKNPRYCISNLPKIQSRKKHFLHFCIFISGRALFLKEDHFNNTLITSL